MSRRVLGVSTVLGVTAILLLIGLLAPPWGPPVQTADDWHRPTADPAPNSALGGAPAGPRRGGDPPEASPGSDQPGPGGATQPSPCGPFPNFPDETCTGWQHTGVELRSCPNEITQSGVTLDGCRFEGGLTIDASDVTITRSLVVGGFVHRRDDRAPLTLIDVEIDGSGRDYPGNESAISGHNYSCVRCHIHDTSRGAQMHSNVRIEDSYIHGFPYLEGAHKTAIGSHGAHDLAVIHNNLDCDVTGCSAALSLYGDFAPIENVLIEKNLLNTTGSYCTYGGSLDSKPYPVGTNIRYLDNRFGREHNPECGIYGPVSSFSSSHTGNVWDGNAWQDGSGPVEP